MPAIFADDFKGQPYWWDRSPPRHFDDDPPANTEVIVVGAGYTGLHAAIATARAGLSTLVIEAAAAGHGCSTRNGGHVSTSIKPGHAALARRYGDAPARAILAEGRASLDYVSRFVADEGIDCDFAVVGRFHGAHKPGQYEKLRATLDARPGDDAWLVPPSRVHEEIGTRRYHGGAVFPRYASLDPGRYHHGLVEVARAAGVRIVTGCALEQLSRGAGGFRLRTGRGELRAERVVLATNGYTGPATPWHRRRLVPIGSYIIATEPLDEALVNRLLPGDRVFCDTRRMMYYYRLSPDRRRILFGGRVSLAESDPRRSAPRLRAELLRLFPELGKVRVSHSWGGFVAYTFDTLPHVGDDDGLYHAMGYCGSGVGMASYLGMRIGRRAAGAADGVTAFDDLPFPTRALYHGRPWFLAPAIAVNRLLDRAGL